MKTSSKKNKGRVLQKWVKKRLEEILEPYNILPEDIDSTAMGRSGEDVVLSPAARALFPFSIECKNVERVNLYQTYEQAAANAGPWEPLCIIKKNHKRPLAVIDAQAFFRMVELFLDASCVELEEDEYEIEFLFEPEEDSNEKY